MDRRSRIVLAIGLLVPTAIAAHLPPGATGSLGGQVQILGPYHGELVAKDGELALFLFDYRDQPLDARQASGTGLVMVGRRQQGLVFAPRSDVLTLVATGDLPAARRPHVVEQVISVPEAAQARFTPAGLLR